MMLKTRLRKLQEQAGVRQSTAEPPAEATCLTGIVRPQLQRLAGPRHKQQRARSRVNEELLARRLHGRCLRPGLILVERCLPLGLPHGQSRLQRSALEALALLGVAPSSTGPTVFLDCETTGLAGGTGTLAFVLGLARLAPHGVQVHQLLLTTFQAEAALLAEASQLLSGTRTLVTFNGKTFDRPLLAARYRMARLADPLSSVDHVDLLHPTRRAFAGRWPDCRLQTVERKLLGFVRTDDLPSACVPQAWFDWLRHGAVDELPRVLQHNRWDLLSLVALASTLGRCYEDPVPHGACPLATLRLRRSAGHRYRYLLTHRDHLDEAALLELARLARRHHHWPLAVSIWRRLAAAQHPNAMEQLAKHYEHREADLVLALRFTRALLALAPEHAAHRHREQRLLRKRSAALRAGHRDAPVKAHPAGVLDN